MRPFLPLLLLGVTLLSACSGGGQSLSSVLTYQDPPAQDWRLVKDSTSTPDCLVLALVGPETALTRGASVTLAVDDAMAAFVPFPNGAYVASAGVYSTTSVGHPDESSRLQLVVGGLIGNKLTAGVFQKDAAEPAKGSGRPLFRVALKAKVGAASGSPISLVVLKATVVPNDLEAANHKPLPIKVRLGVLTVS